MVSFLLHLLHLLLGGGAGAAAAAPPNADGPPLGHTGGFGEPTCQACHGELEVNAPGGALGVEGIPSRYEPGMKYRIRVLLSSDDMGRAGFQGAFRFAAGPQTGRQAGESMADEPRVTVRRDSITGLQFVHHTPRGAEIVIEETLVVWSFDWTAPDSRQPVVFHAAANAANGDNSPFGDLIYTVEARSMGR